MANWEAIKENVKVVADKAVKTTGELADSAAMQIKLKSLEHKRDKKYKELGKLTYRQIKTEESMAERIAPIIDELDEVRAQIKAQAKLIDDAKKARAEARAKKNEE
ncbi:MAG: hypothetical protein IKA76_07205 [Clostridia bacterium]|nr:hypothetical protein [Clostridia bacterium]